MSSSDRAISYFPVPELDRQAVRARRWSRVLILQAGGKVTMAKAPAWTRGCKRPKNGPLERRLRELCHLQACTRIESGAWRAER
jgi:hypothetical protein